MRPYRKEPRYIQRVVVRVSRVSNVLDMLRYDSCYPENQEDSRKLERLLGGSRSPDDHVISFIRAGRNESGPTLRRWQSFGCDVLRVEHPDQKEEDSLNDNTKVKEQNGFVQYSRAWYKDILAKKKLVDDVGIVIGALSGGGCRYEFSVEWQMLGGKLAAELCIFDDAWDAFAEVPEVFKLLAEHSTSWPDHSERDPLTADGFCEKLKALGFVDFTEEIQGQGPVGLKANGAEARH